MFCILYLVFLQHSCCQYLYQCFIWKVIQCFNAFMWLYLLLGKDSTHLLMFMSVIYGTLFPLYMLILVNYHLLLSFFQLPLTPPEPAGMAVPSSFPSVPSLGLQPNFFQLDEMAEEPCGQYPITLAWLQPLLSLLTLVVFVKLYSYYCMCQNVSFPYIFTIHSPVLSVVCHTQTPGQASFTVKHHLHLSPLMISCVPNASTNNGVYFSLAVIFLSATASLE